eukprot:TRINITY_DN11982_c0_g1_i1.p1 TRINITY_DN11982_c0_g1~~TRINITY_DN11982_c0_g1_i1.p1  ORF type:complete len:742 (-),score=148.77 TRINITY_DN11982_c0_g1_i1:182-2407(-)
MVQMQKASAVAHIPPAGRSPSRGSSPSKAALVSSRSGSRGQPASKDVNGIRKAPSTAPSGASRSPPSISKGDLSDGVEDGEGDDDDSEEPGQYERENIESILSQQQRDMHIMIAMHHDQALTLLRKSDEAATEALSENNRLKATIGELRKKNNEFHMRANKTVPTQCQSCATRSLIERELSQTKKVLLKRDEMARITEAENSELRNALSELTSPTAFVRSSDGIEEMTMQDSQDEMFRATASVLRGVKPPISAFSSTAADSTEHRSASNKPNPPAGFDLLGELKLPGQQYDDREGNFFEDPEEEESTEEKFWDKDDTNNTGRRKKVIKVSKGSLLDAKARLQQMFTESALGHDRLKTTGWAQAVVKSQIFENATLLVILTNVIWIGLDTLVNKADLLKDADAGVILLENAFCVYFAVELIIRFLAYKQKTFALTDPWFVFDGLLVGMMILETWVLLAISLATSSAGLDVWDASVLRVLRLVRLARVTRMIRLLHALPEIMILVKALAVAARTVFFTLCLLWAVIYVFAIAFTQMSKGFSVHDQYFRDLWASMFTLLFQGCLGDGLTDLAVACFHDSPILAIILVAYLLFAPLTVLNMLVAVMVNVVNQIATAEHEAISVAYVSESVTDVLRELDLNGNKLISLEEFSSLRQNKELMAKLIEVGLDVFQIVENPDMVFRNDSELTYQEFIDEILLLRVTNTATLKDLVHMRKILLTDIKQVIGNQAAIRKAIPKKKDSKSKR